MKGNKLELNLNILAGKAHSGETDTPTPDDVYLSLAS